MNEKKIDGSLPGLLGCPNSPIAYAKGHDERCFIDGGKTYLRCVPGCRAQATWTEQMDAAYEAYNRDYEQFKTEKYAAPLPETGEHKGTPNE